MAAGGLVAVVLALVVLGSDDDGGPETASDPARVEAGTVCDVTAKPVDDVERFIESLPADANACLAEGVHETDGVTIDSPGITLTSSPGEPATLAGRLSVAPGADGVTVEGLTLDGEDPGRSPSPTIDASRTTFRNNDISNGNTAICFVIGDGPGTPEDVLIEGNRIHDCGKLPATNHHHGIYITDALGTVIRRNLIYDNADRGIQLYPDADGSVIEGNVIDGNGQGIIFSGRDGEVSEDNLVQENVIANSTIRYNVESFWEDGEVGTGNVVRDNCIFGGARASENDGIEVPNEGFEAIDNVIAEPEYADREAADFRLAPGSACAEVLQ